MRPLGDLGGADGRAVVNVPLQVAVATYFLYALLGWSSLVGLLVMVACFPLPGWIATQLDFIAAEQMKRTDTRVQQVSEGACLSRPIRVASLTSDGSYARSADDQAVCVGAENEGEAG